MSLNTVHVANPWYHRSYSILSNVEGIHLFPPPLKPSTSTSTSTSSCLLLLWSYAYILFYLYATLVPTNKHSNEHNAKDSKIYHTQLLPFAGKLDSTTNVTAVIPTLTHWKSWNAVLFDIRLWLTDKICSLVMATVLHTPSPTPMQDAAM